MLEYNRQLYNFVFNIKALKKVYNRMNTDALTVTSYWPCSEVFMTKSFLRNSCAFNRKRARWEEVTDNPNVYYL